MIKYIDAKQILQKNKTLDWFGADYYVNLYRGCSHGCIYCDSRSACYQDTEFNIIKPKRNAIQILETELRRKRKGGIIDTGAMSDPYNPYEKKLELTRNFLLLVQKYQYGVSLTTKGTLIERDIDILKRIAKNAPVICEMTITTSDDNLSRIIEPYAPVSSKRLQSLKRICDENIFAGIVLMPVLPFLEDTKKNILSIVRMASGAGARFIYPYFGVTLRQNQREYYFEKLVELFPNKFYVNEYIENYGNQYECVSLRKAQLEEVFQKECDKYGILYSMDSIVAEYKKNYQDGQMSLFDWFM